MAGIIIPDHRPAVRFERFSYTYPGRSEPALVDLDLEIPVGAFALIAGPSGGGKSTLCRAIVGLVPYLLRGTVTGTVTTLGTNVLAVPPHRLAGRVGYVFQNPEDQIVAQRVENDVAFGPQNLGLPREVIRSRVDEALRLTGLETLRDRPADTLSAGQQQRVAIAGALALQPALLVLDEPTSQLDPGNARRILEFIASLRESLGITIVIAEHRLEWCLPYADQLILVESARASSGRTRALISQPEPLPAYLNLPAAVRIGRARAESRARRGAAAGAESGNVEPVPLSVSELVAQVGKRSACPAHGDAVWAHGWPSPHPGFARPLPEGEAVLNPRPPESASGGPPLPLREAPPIAFPLGEGHRASPMVAGPHRPLPRVAEAHVLPLPPEADRGEGLARSAPGASSGSAPNARTPSPAPLLVVDRVSYRYPNGVQALQEISTAFEAGETVGILGVSGSGKTTLAKHLNGLLRPSRGRVLLDGRETAGMPVSRLARRIGFVFQNPLHQLFAESVRDEVALGLTVAGLPPEAVRERVHSTLARLGVEHLIDRHPLSLSEGERRRVAIAAALAMQPDALVLDEPTLGQDAVERHRLADLIHGLAASGVGTILITHEVDFAIDVCDRLLLLQDGRLVADGPARQVGLDVDLVEEAGLVPPQIAQIGRALERLGIAVAEPTVDAAVAALRREVQW